MQGVCKSDPECTTTSCPTKEEVEQEFKACYYGAIMFVPETCAHAQIIIDSVQECFKAYQCSSGNGFKGDTCHNLLEAYNLKGLFGCSALQVTCPGDLPKATIIGLICGGVALLLLCVACCVYKGCGDYAQDTDGLPGEYAEVFRAAIGKAKQELKAPNFIAHQQEKPTPESDEYHRLGYVVFKRALEILKEEQHDFDFDAYFSGIRLIRDGEYSSLQRCCFSTNVVASHEGPGMLCCGVCCLNQLSLWPLASLFAMLGWKPSPKYDQIDDNFQKPSNVELALCPCLFVYGREGCSFNCLQACPCSPCYAFCIYRPRGVPGYRAPCEEQCCFAPPPNPQYFNTEEGTIVSRPGSGLGVVPQAPEEQIIVDVKH